MILNSIFSRESPEQRELSQRQAQLESLNHQVAERELELATRRGELHAFRAEYYKRLGALYVERDKLASDVAARLAALEPQNVARDTSAAEARERASATEDEVHDQTADGSADAAPFKPSDELKAAYRQAAKMMHPDRAASDEDRTYRNEMMAKVNVAYERMDLETLVRAVNEFHSESSLGSGIGKELVLVIRQEALLRDRLTAITQELAAIEMDETIRLKVRCEDARQQMGRDLLAEMASALKVEIAQLQLRADELAALVADHEAAHAAAVFNGQTATPHAHTGDAAANKSGSHIHRTDRGDFVRSKSELVIANVLNALGLDYRYEEKIVGRVTGGKMLPDFVFITSRDELIVWEHLGMLDKPEYRERWGVKRQWYEDNDFVQGVNFFVSRDQDDGSLDSHVIRKIALLVKTLI